MRCHVLNFLRPVHISVGSVGRVVGRPVGSVGRVVGRPVGSVGRPVGTVGLAGRKRFTQSELVGSVGRLFLYGAISF